MKLYGMKLQETRTDAGVSGPGVLAALEADLEKRRAWLRSPDWRDSCVRISTPGRSSGPESPAPHR